MRSQHLVILATVLILAGCLPRREASRMPAEQIAIPRVERMPNIPQPFRMRDWRAVALGFDRLAFDLDRKGEHLPLIWWDDSRVNTDRRGFGIPSYVGADPGGSKHEGITVMGAVLGATFAGIDKSRGEHNWVLMCEQYVNRRNGLNLVLNRVNTETGQSFWYEIFPHILFYALADRYPRLESMQEIVRATADRWCDAAVAMKGNFDHTAFNFRTMKPVDNGRWTEPDSAAGIAWVQLMAWLRWREPRHLAAARLNAEAGTACDVAKIVNWCFERSTARPDFAVVADRWGGVDCHGLVGAVNRPPRPPGGGYAFAMNTFAMAWPLVPLVRYDDRFARAIGKWMLNAANAARLFYPNEHPPERQSCPGWKGDPDGVVAYEGLRHRWDGDEELFASGDPIRHHWGPKTDLGIYGSAFAGVFGGIIRTTNVEAILQLDCLATDTVRPPAYPTFLYFNPYRVAKEVEIGLRDESDLYEGVSNRFLKRGARGKATLSIPADSAVLLVVAPAGGKVTFDGRRTLVDGVVVDYNNGRVPLP